MLETGMGVGLAIMIFWTPYLLAKGVMKIYMNSEYLSFAEKFSCMIPIFNTIRAEYQWFGKLFLNFYATLLAVLATAFRVFVYMNMRDQMTITKISIWVFIGAFVFFFVSQMILVYRILKDTNATSNAKIILFSIAFPFGQYFIGNYLGNVIRHQQETANSFASEYDDDEDEYDDEEDY